MRVQCPLNTTSQNTETALLALINKIRVESTGHYLLSEGGSWHGGIHITEKSHPNHSFEPIRALADGELVAYRISEDYLQSTYQDQTLQYSNSFCLLRHQCPIPESENTFTFYSLYMHLRPLKYLPGCLFRVKNARSIRNTASPGHADANRTTLPTASLIECLPDVPAEQHQLGEGEGASEYLFVKARRYNPDNEESGNEFWIALHEKNKPDFYTDGFEVLNTQPHWLPQPRITPPDDHQTREDAIPLPEPEDALELQRDQLVILETPIPIRAGDALGYLGLHERLCRVGDGSTEHSYQIHLETFAATPPPESLLNTEHWRWMNEGEITDHEGNSQEDNGFFQRLMESLDENNDDHLSHAEIQRAYRNEETALQLEHLVSFHTNEWHADANQSQYKWWEIYLGQVQAWARGQDERQAFYRRLQDNLNHEKERLTQLKWLDEAQGDLGLSKKVWHLHPIRLVHQLQEHSRARPLTVDDMLVLWTGVPDVPGRYDFMLAVLEEINANLERYKLDTPERQAHFLGQMRQETGSTLSVEENLNYSIEALGEFKVFQERHAGVAGRAAAERIGRIGTVRNPARDADQRAIANYAYADTWVHFAAEGFPADGGRPSDLQLGNTEKDDGWDYRGRGMKQLTGRYNYTRFNQRYHEFWGNDDPDTPSFIENPDLLLQPLYATRSGVDFWLKHELYHIADEGVNPGAINRISIVINGGEGARRRRNRVAFVERIYEHLIRQPGR